MTAQFEDVTNQGSPGMYKEWIRTVVDGGEETKYLAKQWGYHVRVKDPEGVGIGAEIWLDDLKLDHVRRYVVDVGTNEVTTVTVTFLAESVNRDDAS